MNTAEFVSSNIRRAVSGNIFSEKNLEHFLREKNCAVLDHLEGDWRFDERAARTHEAHSQRQHNETKVP